MVEPSQVQKLVERAREGDREAFDELVRDHESRLRSAVEMQLERGPGPRPDADEVVQESLVQAFQSILHFKWRGDESFYLWLCGISRNVILKLARTLCRTRQLQIPERLPASTASPSTALRRGERLDRLEAALAKLPPDYREVLRLSRLERLKVKEIARRMKRSEYAVKHLMMRAVRQLRSHFGDTESLHLPDGGLDLEGDSGGK